MVNNLFRIRCTIIFYSVKLPEPSDTYHHYKGITHACTYASFLTYEHKILVDNSDKVIRSSLTLL